MFLITNKKYFLFSLTISLVLHVSFLFFIGKVSSWYINPGKEVVSESVMKVTIQNPSERVKTSVNKNILKQEEKRDYAYTEKRSNESHEKEKTVTQKPGISIQKFTQENVTAPSNLQSNERVSRLQNNETAWFSNQEIKGRLSMIENRFSYLKKEMGEGTISKLNDIPAFIGKTEQPGQNHATPVIPPDFNINRPPVYPGAARARGMEGTVLLRLKIDSKGIVISAYVEKSSGYPLLDKSALEAAEDWTFYPAKKATREIASEVLVPVTFKLY